MNHVQLLRAYYAATILFLIADLAFGINVRIAFLESSPALRYGYYGVCFACLLLMLWRPGWADVIGTFESLFALMALILNMGIRTMVVTDALLETGTGLVTMEEIVNFVIAGGVAYVSWLRGMHTLFGRSGP